MPDPIGTLNILVEAAVAIAGFSGVVVVFGRRATGEWSPVERGRIRNLLVTSFTVLFLSLATLLLLHAGIASETTWRVGSAIWTVIAAHQVILVLRRYHTVRDDPQRASTVAVVLMTGVTLIIITLNIGNALALSQFWPFLTAQVWLFAVACHSFALLLLFQGRGRQAA
jgi:hypothetical protein